MSPWSPRMTRQSSLWLSVGNAAGLVLAALILPLVSAQFMTIFQDHAIALPWVTVAMHGVPMWMHVAGAAALAGLLILLELFVSNKQVMFRINLVVAALVGVYLTLWLIADAAPLFTMMQAMNTP